MLCPWQTPLGYSFKGQQRVQVEFCWTTKGRGCVDRICARCWPSAPRMDKEGNSTANEFLSDVGQILPLVGFSPAARHQMPPLAPVLRPTCLPVTLSVPAWSFSLGFYWPLIGSLALVQQPTSPIKGRFSLQPSLPLRLAPKATLSI